jgi:hypothetical protein
VFDWRAALRRADEILGDNPAKDWVDRPENIRSILLFRAALPSELCLAANRLATGSLQRAPWKLGRIKAELWSHLSVQAPQWTSYRHLWPLDKSCVDHRPQVLSVRFSSRSDDVGSNPGKAAIDMLCQRRLLSRRTDRYTEHRLGLITDDRRSVVEQLHWSEFQPRKWPSFALIEVRV